MCEPGLWLNNFLSFFISFFSKLIVFFTQLFHFVTLLSMCAPWLKWNNFQVQMQKILVQAMLAGDGGAPESVAGIIMPGINNIRAFHAKR